MKDIHKMHINTPFSYTLNDMVESQSRTKWGKREIVHSTKKDQGCIKTKKKKHEQNKEKLGEIKTTQNNNKIQTGVPL